MPAALQNNKSNGGISDTVQDKASGAVSYAQRFVDWLMPPSSRRRAYENISGLASRRPVLFSFLLSQVILSFLPVFLFLSFSTSCIAVGLGGAIMFSLFWIGIGLLALVPTLLVTSSLATMAWAWCMGTFVIARWIYARIPFSVNAGVQVDAAGKQINVLKDEKGFDGNIKAKDTTEIRK
ncbi:hypothetical protein E4U21_006890 [Claviceps maximensis]|nr:hypothetical protein E4U21_006890 [Claviceps maximensis]